MLSQPSTPIKKAVFVLCLGLGCGAISAEYTMLKAEKIGTPQIERPLLRQPAPTIVNGK
jgi:hypothetical protein